MVRERKTKKRQKSALEKLIVKRRKSALEKRKSALEKLIVKRRKSALEKLIVKRKSALENVKVGGRRRKRKTRRRHRKGKDFDAALKRVIAQHRRYQIARGDKRFKATRGLVKWSRPNKTKRKNRIYYRKRKTRRRRRGGGTYDETPVSDGEHKIIMKENYEKLLRYYGAHAKGHSRDPFGSNAAKAKRDILNTLKKYQCKIPELQASLLKKYGAAPKLTDDLRHPEARRRYNCGQVGGRRRSRRRR